MRHGRGRRRLRGDSGQGLVEFALALPVLLLLCFGVFEFGRYYWTRLTLRHVVREAARFAVTGNVLPDSTGNPMPRQQSIEHLIIKRAEGLRVNLSLSDISLNPSNGGAPGAIVQVNVRYRYVAVFPLVSLVFPNGQVMIRVSTVMKNERF